MSKFFVYAIKLDPAAVHRVEDRSAVQHGASVFYVGQTAHSDQQRLADHIRGGRTSNSAVHDYALALVGHVGPFPTREAAESQERSWASRIKRLGHVVLGGH